MSSIHRIDGGVGAHLVQETGFAPDVARALLRAAQPWTAATGDLGVRLQRLNAGGAANEQCPEKGPRP